MRNVYHTFSELSGFYFDLNPPGKNGKRKLYPQDNPLGVAWGCIRLESTDA